MEQNTNENTNWNELFSLYRSLVSPFLEYEERSKNKRELERKLEWNVKDAKKPVRFDCKRTIRGVISDILKWAIPFLIVFWVIMNVVQVNGEKLLLDMYSELLNPVYDAIYAQLGSMVLIGLFVELFVFGALCPCLVLLFPWMLVRNVIYRMRWVSQKKKKNEETLKACEKAYKELLPQAEAAIQEAWKKIAPHLNRIPPDYRNSRALAFFSKSFFNGKVKNLQEAVNLYDQYLHQQRMEQGQREIAKAQIKAQKESMAAMDDLSRQMAYMQEELQDQIDSLEYHYY